MAEAEITRKVTTAPFGSWKSPITAQFITKSQTPLSKLTSLKDGSLFWIESRPEESGRKVLVKRSVNGECADITPKDFYVRTRVHEYGGKDFYIGDNVGVLFVNFKDQQIYQMSLDGNDLKQITNIESSRFADFVFDANQNQIFSVREDHSDAKNIVNDIVSISLESGELKVVASGADFYAAPRLSPDGSKLAYVSWSHPNMPWDNTQLNVMDLNSNTSEQIAGEDNDCSIMQPAWSPKTGELYFMSDRSNSYWSLHKVHDISKPLSEWKNHTSALILRDGAEFTSSTSSGWLLGQQAYTFTSAGEVWTSFGDKSANGISRIVVLSGASGNESKVLSEFNPTERGLPMNLVEEICPSALSDNELFVLAGSSSHPQGIYTWKMDSKESSLLKSEMSGIEMESFEAYISSPEFVTFPTSENATAYGYFYPPTNREFEPTKGELPPLLVKGHGGPTSKASLDLKFSYQFWTSRGFAILDVDYRGSMGYGREFRRALYDHWGVYDVADVRAGAEYLVKAGKVDGKRVAIDGGSAGGYTTLGALIFGNENKTFSAGCSKYGISDISALAEETHKFESRYLDNLVKPEHYKERSPIHFAENLNCPVLLLQGKEDEVVPPNQSEMMHEVLVKKGIPTALKLYDGEQHGFRKAENIIDALESEFYFFSRVFGFKPADDMAILQIDNEDAIGK